MATQVTQSTLNIWAEINRIKTSPVFQSSSKLIRFLEFTVDEALQGRGHLLREQLIGIEVYGRSKTYDPRVDSVVRVEARRLREKLRKYYETVGSDARLKITYRTGAYIPEFADNPASETTVDQPVDVAVNRSASALYGEGDGACVAVVPFVALSNEEDVRVLAAALTDELVYQFSRSPGFRVAARSFLQLATLESGYLTAHPGDFGTHAAIHGTVQQYGKLFRITVEMSDSTGFVAWSERYDASTLDAHIIQEQIASSVLARLRVDDTRLRLMKVAPALGAVRIFGITARARRAIDENDPQAVSNALKQLTEISRRQSDCAQIFSAIADCHVELFRCGMSSQDDAYEAAKEAVDRAIALDRNSADANCSGASVQGWLRWNWKRAAKYLDIASEIGDSVRSHYLQGIYHSYGGQFDEAVDQLQRASLLDPFSQSVRTATARTLFLGRRYDALIATTERGRVQPDNVSTLRYIALACVLAGERDRAKSIIHRVQTLAYASSPNSLVAAELDAWFDEPRRATRALNDDKTPISARALLCVALGDHASAIAALDTVRKSRLPLALTFHLDPRFDGLRRIERFNQFVQSSREVLMHDRSHFDE